MPRELTQTDVFVLLSERRRMLALLALRAAATPVTTAELARRVADRECQSRPDRDYQVVHVGLHHTHLPRLADADVVRYDRDERTVRPGPNFDTVVRAVESVDGRWGDGNG